jgi:hypothetical protein
MGATSRMVGKLLMRSLLRPPALVPMHLLHCRARHPQVPASCLLRHLQMERGYFVSAGFDCPESL